MCLYASIWLGRTFTCWKASKAFRVMCEVFLINLQKLFFTTDSSVSVTPSIDIVLVLSERLLLCPWEDLCEKLAKSWRLITFWELVGSMNELWLLQRKIWDVIAAKSSLRAPLWSHRLLSESWYRDLLMLSFSNIPRVLVLVLLKVGSTFCCRRELWYKVSKHKRQGFWINSGSLEQLQRNQTTLNFE